ncbi:MAG TPA: hypothetical protein VGU69_10590 [Rhizomicrobium sp.]|nr:hypothetical protein [Rhizomicrobium sp.]
MADYSRPLRIYVANGVSVRCECRTCGHTAVFDARGLARRWGLDIDPMYLRFRCHAPRASDGRRCMSRDIRVLPDFPKNVTDLHKSN